MYINNIQILSIDSEVTQSLKRAALHCTCRRLEFKNIFVVRVNSFIGRQAFFVDILMLEIEICKFLSAYVEIER